MLGKELARVLGSAGSLALKKLGARHAARYERLMAADFLRETDGGEIDRFGLRAVTSAREFFARAKKRQRLEHLRARAKEFAVELLERFGLFDGHFGSELPATLAGADLLTPEPLST